MTDHVMNGFASELAKTASPILRIMRSLSKHNIAGTGKKLSKAKRSTREVPEKALRMMTPGPRAQRFQSPWPLASGKLKGD